MRRLLCIICALVSLSLSGFAQTEAGAPESPADHKGLVINASLGPHLSSADAASTDNFLFSIGAGYCISHHLTAGLRIYTGSVRLSPETAPLLNGFFALGGGEIEGIFSLPSQSRWRPFVSAGFMLATISQYGGIGYNGNGLRVAGGVARDLSRFVSINASVDFSYRRFFNIVNQSDPDGRFSPFIERCVGLQLSISFYSNIVP